MFLACINDGPSYFTRFEYLYLRPHKKCLRLTDKTLTGRNRFKQIKVLFCIVVMMLIGAIDPIVRIAGALRLLSRFRDPKQVGRVCGSLRSRTETTLGNCGFPNVRNVRHARYHPMYIRT